MSNKSLIDRVVDLEAGSKKKSKISDPNINSFTNDEWRYKAYRWYCLKNIVLKLGAMIVSGTTLGAGLIEIVRNAMG